MSKATMTVEGFVAKDPEVRSVNGKTVVQVTVPHTPRRKNASGQFEDAGDTLWVEASFWESEGDAVVAAVRKGMLVTVTGVPELNVYSKSDGSAGASLRLRFATLGVIPRAEIRGGYVPGASDPAAQWAQNTPQASQADRSGGWGAPMATGDDTPF